MRLSAIAACSLVPLLFTGGTALAPLTGYDPNKKPVSEGSVPSAPPAPSEPPTSAPPTSESTPTTDPTTPPPAGGSGGADSPDAAGQAMLRAMGTKDARGACSALAVGGRALSSMGDAMIDSCAKSLQPTLDSGAAYLSALKDAKVSGAQENGDTADFSSARITPSQGTSALKMYKGKKIDGKWYLEQG